MSLLFLSSEDFSIRQGSNGKLLCHDIQQISLVLFYSTHCVYCQQLIPIFKRIGELVPGCQIAMINVSLNKQIISSSQQTITPIKYVPLIILYVNGIPYMEYTDQYNIESIRTFIVNVYKTIEQKVSFGTQQYPNQAHPHVHHTPGQREIPKYSIGEPLFGDDRRCYLELTLNNTNRQ